MKLEPREKAILEYGKALDTIKERKAKAIGNGQVPAVAAVAFGILRGRFERGKI